MFPLFLSPQLMTYMEVSVATKEKAGRVQTQVCGRFKSNDDALAV